MPKPLIQTPAAARAAVPIDKRQVRRQVARAVSTFDHAAVLPRIVADRLIERLDVVRLQPARVLDAGCGTGYCSRALGRRYPRARIVGMDLVPAMAAAARRNAGWFARSRYVSGDAERLPFADGVFDLVVSNLMLPWCDPASVFSEFLRATRSGGLVVFTSFGPDTLQELRAAWRAVDEQAHVHAFLDMHDVGDALVRAGFADPVMDVERFTLTYPDVDGVLHELRALGAQNAQLARARGLMGRGRLQRLKTAYGAMAQDDGRIPATYEVVYGHAWVPEQKRVHGGAVAIPVETLRRRR